MRAGIVGSPAHSSCTGWCARDRGAESKWDDQWASILMYCKKGPIANAAISRMECKRDGLNTLPLMDLLEDSAEAMLGGAEC